MSIYIYTIFLFNLRPFKTTELFCSMLWLYSFVLAINMSINVHRQIKMAAMVQWLCLLERISFLIYMYKQHETNSIKSFLSLTLNDIICDLLYYITIDCWYSSLNRSKKNIKMQLKRGYYKVRI